MSCADCFFAGCVDSAGRLVLYGMVLFCLVYGDCGFADSVVSCWLVGVWLVCLL